MVDNQPTHLKTIKFNVGGRHFEVSRALIEQQPESLLGQMVSEKWQTDLEKSGFIDRDGGFFTQVQIG